MSNMLTEYKAVNEEHLPVADRFVRRVLDILNKGGELNIKAYRVEDTNYSGTEQLNVEIDANTTLALSITRCK